MNVEKNERGELDNPLFDSYVKWTVCDWKEWRSEFRSTTNPLLLLQLLHCGFDVKADGDERAERIAFYLRVAHMHYAIDRFTRMHEGFDSRTAEAHHLCDKSLAYTRQEISKKALAVLASKMQKMCEPSYDGDDAGEFEHYIVSLELAETLFLFFDKALDFSDLPYNLSKVDNRYREWIVLFYTRYMTSLIAARRRFVKYSFEAEVKQRVYDALPRLQPEALRILMVLRKYNEIAMVAEYVLPESLDSLRKMILSSTHKYVKKKRKSWYEKDQIDSCRPKSIEEAVSLGIQPAIIYQMLKAVCKTRKTVLA